MLPEKNLKIILKIIFFSIFLSNLALTNSSSEETPDSRGKICLFFDDGWKNQYDRALPVLREFGFRASFGIISDYIGTDRKSFWSRMNVSELRELELLGMEIASHTMTHPSMLNLTDEQLHREVAGSKMSLTQLGFSVNTFIYPYGEWNSTVIEHVKEAGYICARDLTGEPYRLHDAEPDARFHVGSWPITNQSLNEFKEILAHSTETEVVVFTYHFISDEGPESTSTSTANFYHQMKYLKQSGFDVILLSELFEEKEVTMWRRPPFITLIISTFGFITILVILYLTSNTHIREGGQQTIRG